MLYSVDYHDGNIAIAGGSSSTGLVSSTNVPNPFVVMYDNGGNILWGK